MKNLIKKIILVLSFLILATIIFILSVIIHTFLAPRETSWVLFLSFVVFFAGSFILSIDYINIIRSYKSPEDLNLKKFSEKGNLIAVIFKTILYLVVIYLLVLLGGYVEKQKQINANEQKIYNQKQKEKKKQKQKYNYLNDRYYKCYGEMTAAHKARGFHQSNREASIKVKDAVCKAYGKGEELNYEGKR
jgi:NADH:ubiquinone oxidoreductase subunit 5 (subunit L)/multisubunit Na+/H+ antiporter MnhA subunit